MTLFKINQRQITSNLVLKAPELNLQVLESKELHDTYFKINAKGLITSSRDEDDGYVLFGSSYYFMHQIQSDVHAFTSEYGFGGRHFIIFYDTELNEYFLKDLGEGSGTFVKLEQELKLKNGNIISFTDNHMLISIKENDSIFIKFLEGTK